MPLLSTGLSQWSSMARTTSLLVCSWRDTVLGKTTVVHLKCIFMKLQCFNEIHYQRETNCKLLIWLYKCVCVRLFICTHVFSPGRLTSVPACSVRLPWCITSVGLCTAAAACRLCWRSWTLLCLVISTQSSTTPGAASVNRSVIMNVEFQYTHQM